MKQTSRIYLTLLAGGLALLAAMLACNLPSFGQGGQANATLTALSAAVAGTATAGAGEDGGDGSELATALSEATRRSQEVQATRTVESFGRDEAALATATVAAPVVAELPRYGLDPELGRLGWLHDPVDVIIGGYHQYSYANDHMQVVAKDFVLAADITWDTQYGASGCGFMFRSNGDQNSPDQYLVVATRLGSGHVVFTAVADGQLANVRDYYARSLDRSFQWENGSTNRLAVVGRGPIITVYTNGVELGEIDTTLPPPPPVLPSRPKPPVDASDLEAAAKFKNLLKEYEDLASQVQSNYQLALQNYQKTEAVFAEGFVAMVALSESGHTECKFENAWLWLIE